MIRKVEYAFVALLAVLLGACVDYKEEITELHHEIDQLKTEISEINHNISALQTLTVVLRDSDFVTSVTSVEDNGKVIGYTFGFYKSGQVTVYLGKDGYTPVVGVRQGKDGHWYWTLNGLWLLNDYGEMLRADAEDGMVPQLKIEEDYWYVSYDQGVTWTQLDKSSHGDSMFKDIRITDKEIVLVLNDESLTEIVIPKRQPVEISFSCGSDSIPISANETVKIAYTLSSGNDVTTVAVATDGQYTAVVKKTDHTQGIIEVTCPLQFKEGMVNVFVYDADGCLSMRTLSFYEKQLSFEAGTQYAVGVEGGEMAIPYSTNFEFDCLLDPDTDWMSVSVEKNDSQHGHLLVAVKANSGTARTGRIHITPLVGNGKAFVTLAINQASSYYHIDYSTFLAESAGGAFVATVQTSRGLSLQIPEPAQTWLSYSVETEKDEYRVRFQIAENRTADRRDAVVDVYAADGTGEKLGEIQIGQLPAESDFSRTMVFRVRACDFNDSEVYLPIAETDCYVDWGDGTVEYVHVDGKTAVRHPYEKRGSEYYEVKVSGTVKSLTSINIPEGNKYGVVSVRQWGNTGLLSMKEAFSGIWSLTDIADDATSAFADVTTFENAFRECNALRTLPEGLFSHGTHIESLAGVFAGCANLESIPENLFAECGNVQNLHGAFQSCMSLQQIPAGLFSSCRNAVDVGYMFSGCNHLNTLPSGLFSAFEKVLSYPYVFSGCSSLTTVPENLFENSTGVTNFSGVFSGCSSLSSLPENLFSHNPEVTDFSYVFQECTSLPSVPEKIFAGNVKVKSFYRAFYYCLALTSVPAALFDTNVNVKDFSYCFFYCEALSSESPYTLIDGEKVHLYERVWHPEFFVKPTSSGYCFNLCLNIPDYAQIPTEWKK